MELIKNSWLFKNSRHSHLFWILQQRFQGMKNSRYSVQSLNTLNKCSLGVEKYVRNVVDDVMGSWGIFVMNAYSILWSGWEIVPWCANFRIGRKNFSRKMGNTKVTGIDWPNATKDTRESWNIEHSLKCGWRVEGCLIVHKRRGNNLWFWP